jgi:FixJ family two-component response regulator
MRQGAKDYLVKPVSEAQLVEKVRAALGDND